MLGSLDEAQAVLADRGVELDTKTVRLIAYRYAARARLEQQIERTAFERIFRLEMRQLIDSKRQHRKA
jgi:hypothetical protein